MEHIQSEAGWITDKIHNLPIEFVDGDRSNKYPKRDEFVSEGIPFLNAMSINQGYLELSKANFITAEKFATIKKGRLQQGDLILTTRGNGVGNAAYFSGKTKTGLINAQLLILRPKPERISPRFLYYLFISPYVQDLIRNFVSGSAQPQLPIQSIRNIELSYPPLPTQRKIAAILSAYDDLIENNTRRIKILEEMAQALYREWFVNFRFPGHEKVRMEESELGPKPVGWEVKTLEDIADYINRGISPKYDDNAENIVINQRCIRDGKINLYLARRQSKRVAAEKFIQFGDILINSTGVGTLGRVAQVYQYIHNCTVDSHVSIVRPGHEVNVDYFGLYLLCLHPYFEGLGAGSTGQTELRRQLIAETLFLLPPRVIQDSFADFVSPIRKSIIQRLDQNANLHRTRDFILPKLISGEVDVSELDTKIPDEAEA